MNPTGKIGLFDAGVGGLGIMRSLVQQLPKYNYLYLGDTLHTPYGPKPAADVRGYCQQAVSYLFDQGCELVLIVCNTATAQSLRFVQQQFLPTYAPHRRVLGVIIPAAEAAVLATKNNRIGVLATQGTVDARSFAEELQKLRPQVAVYQQAAPELASLIEAGLLHTVETKIMIRHYMQPLLQAGIDTLILGCTHYELISDAIAEVIGSNVTLIHEPPVVANRLQDYLFRHADLNRKLAQDGGRRLIFTSHAEAFTGLGRVFLGAAFTAEEIRV